MRAGSQVVVQELPAPQLEKPEDDKAADAAANAEVAYAAAAIKSDSQMECHSAIASVAALSLSEPDAASAAETASSVPLPPRSESSVDKKSRSDRSQNWGSVSSSALRALRRDSEEGLLRGGRFEARRVTYELLHEDLYPPTAGRLDQSLTVDNLENHNVVTKWLDDPQNEETNRVLSQKAALEAFGETPSIFERHYLFAEPAIVPSENLVQIRHRGGIGRFGPYLSHAEPAPIVPPAVSAHFRMQAAVALDASETRGKLEKKLRAHRERRKRGSRKRPGRIR